MNWYYAFWSYPEIYEDDLFRYYIQRFANGQSTNFMYLINAGIFYATEQDRELRPTEVAAMESIYHQARYAQLLRDSEAIRDV